MYYTRFQQVKKEVEQEKHRIFNEARNEVVNEVFDKWEQWIADGMDDTKRPKLEDCSFHKR